jgi:mRNA interferase RelE/StbE
MTCIRKFMGMMTKMYDIKIAKDAEKFILKQDKQTQQRLFKEIFKLKESPKFQSNVTRLTGSTAYRKRVGGFRILYEVLDDVLLVHVTDVGNRGDIYK